MLFFYYIVYINFDDDDFILKIPVLFPYLYICAELQRWTVGERIDPVADF